MATELGIQKQSRGNAMGIIQFQILPENWGKATGIRAIVKSLTLSGVEPKGTLLAKDRNIQLAPIAKSGVDFIVRAPEGDYEALEIGISGIAIRVQKQWTEPRSAEVGFKLRIRVRRNRPALVEIRLDVDALAHGDDLRRALNVKSDMPVPEREFRMPKGEPARFELRISSTLSPVDISTALAIPAGALPPDTHVVLRIPDGDGLPALFRGQKIVGPLVEVHSSAALAGQVE